jgi:hypothetical protein
MNDLPIVGIVLVLHGKCCFMADSKSFGCMEIVPMHEWKISA